MHNSATINLNVLECMREHNQTFDATRPKSSIVEALVCTQSIISLTLTILTAEKNLPILLILIQSMVGKNYSVSDYLSYSRNYSIPVCVSRYHNIFGPEGTGGRKRKSSCGNLSCALLPEEGEIEVWGDGKQTRSFLYIDECIDATYRLMQSDFAGPVNIGSEEMVTINALVDKAQKASGKKLLENIN